MLLDQVLVVGIRLAAKRVDAGKVARFVGICDDISQYKIRSMIRLAREARQNSLISVGKR